METPERDRGQSPESDSDYAMSPPETLQQSRCSQQRQEPQRDPQQPPQQEHQQGLEVDGGEGPDEESPLPSPVALLRAVPSLEAIEEPPLAMYPLAVATARPMASRPITPSLSSSSSSPPSGSMTSHLVFDCLALASSAPKTLTAMGLTVGAGGGRRETTGGSRPRAKTEPHRHSPSPKPPTHAVTAVEAAEPVGGDSLLPPRRRGGSKPAGLLFMSKSLRVDACEAGLRLPFKPAAPHIEPHTEPQGETSCRLQEDLPVDIRHDFIPTSEGGRPQGGGLERPGSAHKGRCHIGGRPGSARGTRHEERSHRRVSPESPLSGERTMPPRSSLQAMQQQDSSSSDYISPLGRGEMPLADSMSPPPEATFLHQPHQTQQRMLPALAGGELPSASALEAYLPIPPHVQPWRMRGGGRPGTPAVGGLGGPVTPATDSRGDGGSALPFAAAGRNHGLSPPSPACWDQGGDVPSTTPACIPPGLASWAGSGGGRPSTPATTGGRMQGGGLGAACQRPATPAIGATPGRGMGLLPRRSASKMSGRGELHSTAEEAAWRSGMEAPLSTPQRIRLQAEHEHRDLPSLKPQPQARSPLAFGASSTELFEARDLAPGLGRKPLPDLTGPIRVGDQE